MAFKIFFTRVSDVKKQPSDKYPEAEIVIESMDYDGEFPATLETLLSCLENKFPDGEIVDQKDRRNEVGEVSWFGTPEVQADKLNELHAKRGRV